MSRANEDDNWRAREPPVEQHVALPDVIRSRGRGHPDHPSTRPRPFVPRIFAQPFFPRSDMGYGSLWSQQRHVQAVFPVPPILPTTPPPPPPQLMTPPLGPPLNMPFNAYHVFRGFSARAANGHELQVTQCASPQQRVPHFHIHYQRHAPGPFLAQGYTHAPGPFPAQGYTHAPGPFPAQGYTHAPGPFPAQGYTHTPMIPFNAEPRTRDEGTQTRLRRPRQNPRARTWRNAGFCTFCRNSGESEEVYRSHLLKARRTEILCPSLTGIVCPFCQATGQEAHTRRHCPVNIEARRQGIILVAPGDFTQGEGQAEGDNSTE